MSKPQHEVIKKFVIMVFEKANISAGANKPLVEALSNLIESTIDVCELRQDGNVKEAVAILLAKQLKILQLSDNEELTCFAALAGFFLSVRGDAEFMLFGPEGAIISATLLLYDAWGTYEKCEPYIDKLNRDKVVQSPLGNSARVWTTNERLQVVTRLQR